MSTRPIVDRLMVAQHNLCFHCNIVMQPRKGGQPSAQQWTREHVFPKCRHPGMSNNFVLAHRTCNTKRGDRMPTDAEIDRARAIYQRMNMTPFIPADEENIAKSRAATDRSLRSKSFFYEDGMIKPVTSCRSSHKG